MGDGIFSFAFDYADSPQGRLLVIGSDQIAADRLIDTGVQMLKAHEIPAVLPMELEITDLKARLSYVLKGKKPLADILRGRKISAQEFSKILHQILHAIIDSPRYFLNENNFCLDMRHIYSTPDYDLGLVYLPIKELTIKGSVIDELRNNIVTVLYTCVLDRDLSVSKPILEYFLSGEFSLSEIDERLQQQLSKNLSRGNATPDSPLGNLDRKMASEKVASVPPSGDRYQDAGRQGRQSSQSLSKPSQGEEGEGKHLKQAGKKGGTVKAKNGLSRQKLILYPAIILVIAIWVVFIKLGQGKYQQGALYLSVGFTILTADVAFALMKLWLDIPNKFSSQSKMEVEKQVAVAKEDEFIKRRSAEPNALGQEKGTAMLNNLTVALSEAYLAVSNGERYEKIDLGILPVLIGRGKIYGTYQLSDTTVSSNHARIEKVNGQYVIIDLNSTNKTLINGMKLEANRHYPLNDGDMIRMGRTDFSFRVEL